MKRHRSTAAIVVAIGAAVGAVVAVCVRMRRTMGDELADTILSYLPTPDSVLGPGAAAFDELMGGKLGTGRWARYEQGHGTNCGVAMVGFGIAAGLPPDLLNAAPPAGSGFTPGAHFSRLRSGAQARGWLRNPVAGQLPDVRRGDIFVSEKPPRDGVDGAHVGVVLSAERSGDAIELETADGGQDGGVAIRRRRRTVRFSDGALAYWDGSSIPAGTVAIITPGVGNTRLEWWVRPGGDS